MGVADLVDSSDAKVQAAVRSPLAHHFIAQAVVTLVQAAADPKLRPDAVNAIIRIQHGLHHLESQETRAVLDSSLSWDIAIRDYITAKLSLLDIPSATSAADNTVATREAMALQHLAEAAVGNKKSGSGAKASDSKSGITNGSADGNGGEDVMDIDASIAQRMAAAVQQQLGAGTGASGDAGDVVGGKVDLWGGMLEKGYLNIVKEGAAAAAAGASASGVDA
jgi:hypothetical protein